MNNVKNGHKTKQSYANKRTTGKEQYYTSPVAVDICIAELARNISLGEHKILEPAGGTGEFIKGLVRAGIKEDQIISYDIEPRYDRIIEANFLEVDPTQFSGTVCVTNPPFGRANSLSKKFFNHAAKGCDYIGFLVPKSWRKWSVINSLDLNFDLVSEIEMPKNCFYKPDSSSSDKGVLKTIFQIWKRTEQPRKKIKIKDHGLLKKVLPRNGFVEGANVAMIVFGHSCGKIEKISGKVKSKTTTMYLQVENPEVYDHLISLDLSKFYNNVAYVQALSLQEINHELNKKLGLETFCFKSPLITK
tara:strand:- start:11295 stop:12203 length:909 start_codon:yes stop_codon:yes gene_type:complete